MEEHIHKEKCQGGEKAKLENDQKERLRSLIQRERGEYGIIDIFIIHLPIHVQGCFSGNNDQLLAIRQKSGKPAFTFYHSQDIQKSLDIAPQKMYKHSYHSSSKAQINKNHQIVNSAFPRPAYDPSLNLLAMAGQDLEVENLPIPAANVIVVIS
ncbi:receptor-type tyrosine-protein phosphatase R-like [Crocuta crocuta]